MTETGSCPSDAVFREARDADAEAVIALVAAAYAEYPGCVLDVDGELPELRAPASAHAAAGGGFWVAELDGQVAASAGWQPLDNGGIELLKLYVAPAARGQGLGRRLVELVCAEGRKAGAGHVELWTDTRFTAAHSLYERLGFARSPGSRQLDDLSRSREYHYSRPL